MKEVVKMIKTVFVLQKRETSALAKKTYGERQIVSKPKEHSLLCVRSYGKEITNNEGSIIHGKKSTSGNK